MERLDPVQIRVLGCLLEKQQHDAGRVPAHPQLAADRMQPGDEPRAGGRLRRSDCAGGRRSGLATARLDAACPALPRQPRRLQVPASGRRGARSLGRRSEALLCAPDAARARRQSVSSSSAVERAACVPRAEGDRWRKRSTASPSTASGDGRSDRPGQKKTRYTHLLEQDEETRRAEMSCP